MTRQDRNKRRALIVRRWAAYRIGCAQREIWRKRRGDQVEEDPEGAVVEDELFASLPEGLLA